MSQKKEPNLTMAQIKRLLSSHISGSIGELTPVEGGNWSSAYSFTLDGREYGIKMNPSDEAYEHELFVSRLLRPQGVPYSHVLGTGREEGYNYCISEWIRGGMFHDLQHDRKVALLPELVRVITSMNRVQLGDHTGYGFIGADKNGRYPSWEAFVIAFYDEHQKGTFWEGWHGLFETTCLERHVFDELYGRLMAYVKYNEPHRHFVHHDCHEWNIISDGHSINGIIDANCVYGDFMIDVATIESAVPGIDVAEAFRAHYEEVGLNVPNFDERLAGALYFKGLDALRFYAKMGWDHAYYELRDRLLAMN